MLTKITRLDWLIQTIGALDDDLTRPWSDYPCLEWPFARMPHGYGKLADVDKSATKRNWLVHRKSFEISRNVSLRPDIKVCHHCDHPPCFRPIHLFDSSQKGNLEDCRAKGRHQHGTGHYKASVTDELVVEIRSLHARGVRLRDLAVQFGLDADSTLWAMVHGKTWKHLPVLDRSNAQKDRKLNEGQVREIRRLYAEGKGTRQLASQFNVLPQTIWSITRRKSWASLI